MHFLFLAFVVIVILLRFGFGRVMGKVLFVTFGIAAGIAALIILANVLDRPTQSAQVSYQTQAAPIQAKPDTRKRAWFYLNVYNSQEIGPFATYQAAETDCTPRQAWTDCQPMVCFTSADGQQCAEISLDDNFMPAPEGAPACLHPNPSPYSADPVRPKWCLDEQQPAPAPAQPERSSAAEPIPESTVHWIYTAYFDDAAGKLIRTETYGPFPTREATLAECHARNVRCDDAALMIDGMPQDWLAEGRTRPCTPAEYQTALCQSFALWTLAHQHGVPPESQAAFWPAPTPAKRTSDGPYKKALEQLLTTPALTPLGN
jgi:hypothetical protein